MENSLREVKRELGPPLYPSSQQSQKSSHSAPVRTRKVYWERRSPDANRSRSSPTSYGHAKECHYLYTKERNRERHRPKNLPGGFQLGVITSVKPRVRALPSSLSFISTDDRETIRDTPIWRENSILPLANCGRGHLECQNEATDLRASSPPSCSSGDSAGTGACHHAL